MLATAYKFILFLIWLAGVYFAAVILQALQLSPLLQVIGILWAVGMLGWGAVKASSIVSLTWGRMS